jgi:tetratricopeptide (TPR) repeat protein
MSAISGIWEVIAGSVQTVLNYWELYMGWLPFSRLILIGLVLLVILAPALVVLARLRGKQGPKAPGKLSTGRDIRREAKWCEKNHEYLRAGELYESIEQYDKAVRMYQLGRAPERAARVYHEKLGDFDSGLKALADAGAWENAGYYSAKAERHEEAAASFEKAGKFQAAAESYQKAGSLNQAGALYEKAGFLEQAAVVYGQANNFKKAAELYSGVWEQIRKDLSRDNSAAARKKIEETAKRAAYYYKQLGEWKKSAEILEQSGIKKFAAELYLLAGEKAKAAELFQQIGAGDKAAELYEQAGDKQKAAELRAQYHMKQNELAPAAQYFEEAGDPFQAADIYLRLGQDKKAAELYMQGGDSKTAADIYFKIGEYRLAGSAYETAGNFEMALEVYKQIKDETKMAELYEKSGDYFNAGVNYYRNGLAQRAVAAFSQVPEKSSDFLTALETSGDIYWQMGNNEQALNCYRRLAQKKPFSAENVELYYKIGQIYERAGQVSYAVNLYQRIFQVAPQFADVTLRLQNISQKMGSSGQMQAGPGATVAGQGAMGSGGGFRYQIIKEIGRGGMGVVYLAKDVNLGRQVAYKVLPQEMKKHPEIVANFIREAKNLAQLNHPYIVSIFDAGEYSGNYFIVMEFVEGENLKELISRSKRVPLRIGIEVFKQLAQALDYAHSKKVVHRDIKPANIMWTENQSIKVMDFGLATLLEEVKTGRTLVSGTPLYMSPEQTLGKPLDHRTDIYSAGASMYELFCGRAPFIEGDIPYQQIHNQPKAPKDLNPELPDELSRIMMKCLSKDVSQRFQNGRELYLDLKAIEG